MFTLYFDGSFYFFLLLCIIENFSWKYFVKLHKQQQMTSLTSFPFKVYSHLSFLLIFLEIAVWLTTSTSLFTYRSLILNPHNLLEAALSKDCLYLSSANSFSTALRNREDSFTAEGRRQDVQCGDRGVLLQKLLQDFLTYGDLFINIRSPGRCHSNPSEEVTVDSANHRSLDWAEDKFLLCLPSDLQQKNKGVLRCRHLPPGDGLRILVMGTKHALK